MTEEETQNETIETPAAEEASVQSVAEAEVAETETGAAEIPTGSDHAAPDSEHAEGTPSASAKRKRKRLPRALRPRKGRAKRAPSSERKPITRLPKLEHARGRRQERQGLVVSASADKTIVVRVDVAKVHPIYKKVVKRSTRFHAHDEENRAKVGDVVRIVETRPLSRLKRWRLQEIVEAAK